MLGKKISVQGFKSKEIQKGFKAAAAPLGNRGWKSEFGQTHTMLSQPTPQVNESSMLEYEGEHQEDYFYDGALAQNQVCPSGFGFGEISLMCRDEQLIQQTQLAPTVGLELDSSAPVKVLSQAVGRGLKLSHPTTAGSRGKQTSGKSEFYASLARTALLSQGNEYEDYEQNYRFNGPGRRPRWLLSLMF